MDYISTRSKWKYKKEDDDKFNNSDTEINSFSFIEINIIKSIKSTFGCTTKQAEKIINEVLEFAISNDYIIGGSFSLMYWGIFNFRHFHDFDFVDTKNIIKNKNSIIKEDKKSNEYLEDDENRKSSNLNSGIRICIFNTPDVNYKEVEFFGKKVKIGLPEDAMNAKLNYTKSFLKSRKIDYLDTDLSNLDNFFQTFEYRKYRLSYKHLNDLQIFLKSYYYKINYTNSIPKYNIEFI